MKDKKIKTKVEITNELKTKREALRQFRFDISGSKIRNVKLGLGLRKDIARLLTQLNTRENA